MTFQNERPLPAIENYVIMRNTYYDPTALRASAEWARAKLAATCSAWERRHLQSQIGRISWPASRRRA